jgi:endoglucanase
MNKFILQLLFAGLALQAGFTQNRTELIRLNQLGFYPEGPKIAIAAAEVRGEFFIATPDLKKKEFTGMLGGQQVSSISGKTTTIADFSKFKKPGTWVVWVPSLGHSWPFEIKPNVHHDLAVAALKSFYHQRMSTDQPERYAGKWHRPLSHPDKNVFIHPSAATGARPKNTVIESPGGWYDAGDYNKYIVNSGITVGTLLALYEDFPDYFKKMETNIPESGNGVPDLLDEALWNLRWMLTMQDPSDGGVYHKCTTAKFEGFVKPEEAKAQRYVVQKSTAATLDFAAVMAQAARVFSGYELEFPGLADKFLKASKSAWQWARANPATLYDQGKMNERFEPKIETGAYGDNNVTDEFIWAAMELYVTTGEDEYFQAVDLFPSEGLTVQNWGDVRTMGYLTLLRHENRLTPAAETPMRYLKGMYIAFAKGLVYKTESQAYLAPMENNVENYVWGSTAVCANQGINLIYAYRLTNDQVYLNYALDNLDYLLGRNATGYSFITGYGDKTPMHIHHRPSETDGVDDPVPGLLAGGPNPNQQDKCETYPNKIPDESYTDDVCSYASNEIAINWNAPLVYLAFAVDILK